MYDFVYFCFGTIQHYTNQIILTFFKIKVVLSVKINGILPNKSSSFDAFTTTIIKLDMYTSAVKVTSNSFVKKLGKHEPIPRFKG